MDNKEVFSGIWSYKDKAGRAQARCKQISEDEAVMGYTETSELYSTLALEMKESNAYVEEILRTLLEPVV